MSYFLKQGNTFRVATKEQMDLHDFLPTANYAIKLSQEGYYLEHIESFVGPAKTYGDLHTNTDRILNTFLKRENSTGVLLCGEKGSGKSLLAKNISIVAAKQNVPTLIINAAYYGDAFNAFLQKITQPCIILLDEYEKVYDTTEQTQLLTLLDGVYTSKKLFLLTVNDKWKIDQHMRNRPGRIFYLIEYSGLSDDFIREYCEDNLNNKTEINRIIQITQTFDKFNFDMLKALVEEMNRYNEPVVKAIKYLNVKAEFASHVNYEVSITIDGKEVTKEYLVTKQFRGNPLSQKVAIGFYMKDIEGNVVDVERNFLPTDLRSIEDNGRNYIFEKADSVMTLKKEQHVTYNHMDYID